MSYSITCKLEKQRDIYACAGGMRDETEKALLARTAVLSYALCNSLVIVAPGRVRTEPLRNPGRFTQTYSNDGDSPAKNESKAQQWGAVENRYSLSLGNQRSGIDKVTTGDDISAIEA